MAVLTTDRLTKVYKGRPAVKDVNMHIEEGDIYGFVGENGAGKTTVIRLITGLAEPTSGTYSLYGISSKDPAISEVKKTIGAIVETATMNRSMTALENLRFQCLVTGTEKSDEELIALIGRVGLDYEAIKKKKVGNFSLGMKQRLGIAIVMVSDAKFVILDEPMNGLDPPGFIEVRETILKLHQEGVTFLISSHILAELEKICTKIGVISHGELLEEITMEELHRKAARRTIVETDDPESTASILRESGFEGAVVEEGKTFLYGDTDINAILKILVEKEVPVQKINTLEDTVEDHYIRLLGRRLQS